MDYNKRNVTLGVLIINHQVTAQFSLIYLPFESPSFIVALGVLKIVVFILGLCTLLPYAFNQNNLFSSIKGTG